MSEIRRGLLLHPSRPLDTTKSAASGESVLGAAAHWIVTLSGDAVWSSRLLVGGALPPEYTGMRVICGAARKGEES